MLPGLPTLQMVAGDYLQYDLPNLEDNFIIKITLGLADAFAKYRDRSFTFRPRDEDVGTYKIILSFKDESIKS